MGPKMGKSGKRHATEIRFSLPSLLCLFFIWLCVSGLAFYVGTLVGRMGQIREIRRVYRVDEKAMAVEEPPVFSFEESLTAPEAGGDAGKPSPVPQPPVTRPVPPRSAGGSISGTTVLQVASFRTPERAEQLVRELRQKGYRCFQRAPGPSGAGGGYCRVFVGPLPSPEMAAQVKERLEEEEGYKGILTRSIGK